MNQTHIQLAAQAGAEAVRDFTIGQKPQAWDEAFATTAISKYLELQSADIPSVEDCFDIYRQTPLVKEGEVYASAKNGLAAVRTAIVAAYEARATKVENGDAL